MLTLLLLPAVAIADLAPPRLSTGSCDARRCAGLASRLCAGPCAPEAEGWARVCSLGREALYCRPSTATARPPAPDLARALTDAPADYLRLPSAAFGRSAYDPIGAWGDDQVFASVPYGSLLRPIDPEAYTPVTQAPLPIRAADGGPSLGTLRIGTAVTPGEGGALTVHIEHLSVAAWAATAPRVGRTFPEQPEPPEEGEPACLPVGAALHGAPDGAVVARNQGAACMIGWQAIGDGEQGWQKLRHRYSGLEGWIAPAHLSAAVGYLGLPGTGGVYGGGSAPRKILSSPRFVYAAPDGAVVGYLLGGQYLVEEARPDGWWRADVHASGGGPVSVWFPPDPPEEEEEVEGVGGCSAAGLGSGAVWLVGLLGVLRRSGRSARRAGGRRRAGEG